MIFQTVGADPEIFAGEVSVQDTVYSCKRFCTIFTFSLIAFDATCHHLTMCYFEISFYILTVSLGSESRVAPLPPCDIIGKTFLGGLGAEPQRLEILRFFCKINLILSIF